MSDHLNDQHLIAYLTRTLSDVQRAEVDRHATGCERCRTRLEYHAVLQRRIRNSVLAQHKTSPSSHVTFAQIAPQIRQARARARFLGQPRQFVFNALALAALVALVVLLIGLFSNINQPVAVINSTPALTLTASTPAPTPMLATAAPTPIPKPISAPQLVWKIENNPDPLSAPFGLALDQQGNVYVVDAGNSRVVKYDRNGKFLTQWGGPGHGDGQFSLTNNGNFASVAVDNQGHVYVTDADNSRIQKFDDTGHFLMKWGSAGAGAGQFVAPAGLAVDSQGNVYVADVGTARVQKFSSAGQLLPWKSNGSPNEPIVEPIDVAIDKQDFIYIADRTNGNVQKFDQNGNPLASWALNCGSGSDQVVTPSAIALDTSGNLYVADGQNNRICKFDPNGKFMTTWGRTGNGDGEFNLTGGIAVDDQGNVYVADANNARILKFSQP